MKESCFNIIYIFHPTNLVLIVIAHNILIILIHHSFMISFSFGLSWSNFTILGRAYLLTLKNSGLLTPPSLVQSYANSLFSMSYGRLLTPTSAPTRPPTMHAFVSVSPPCLIVSLILS